MKTLPCLVVMHHGQNERNFARPRAERDRRKRSTCLVTRTAHGPQAWWWCLPGFHVEVARPALSWSGQGVTAAVTSIFVHVQLSQSMATAFASLPFFSTLSTGHAKAVLKSARLQRRRPKMKIVWKKTERSFGMWPPTPYINPRPRRLRVFDFIIYSRDRDGTGARVRARVPTSARYPRKRCICTNARAAKLWHDWLINALGLGMDWSVASPVFLSPNVGQRLLLKTRTLCVCSSCLPRLQIRVGFSFPTQVSVSSPRAIHSQTAAKWTVSISGVEKSVAGDRPVLSCVDCRRASGHPSELWPTKTPAGQLRASLTRTGRWTRHDDG